MLISDSRRLLFVHVQKTGGSTIDNSLTALFRPVDGKRPADGKRIEASDSPLWRDHPTFSEFFDGDTGEGLGATHQTGWTALVAHLLNPRLPPDPR